MSQIYEKGDFMNFSEILNKYLNILNCSAQDLANESNLSPTLVSRYLNNKRTPRQKSEYLNKVVDGIYNLSIKNNLNLNKEEILEELNRSIIVESIDFDDFVDNFNCLIVELKINISDTVYSQLDSCGCESICVNAELVNDGYILKFEVEGRAPATNITIDLLLTEVVNLS